MRRFSIHSVKLLKKKNGFSLVELLVAIAIFGVMMIAFLSLFASTFYLTLRAGNRDKSVAYISGKVENQIARPTDTITDVAQTDTSVTIHFTPTDEESVPVKKFTGTTVTEDGLNVVIDYYKP